MLEFSFSEDFGVFKVCDIFESDFYQVAYFLLCFGYFGDVVLFHGIVLPRAERIATQRALFLWRALMQIPKDNKDE